MSEYPEGPFPNVDDFDARMGEAIRDVGVANLTVKVLRQRLEAVYKVNLTPHKDTMLTRMKNLMEQPDFQKQLAQVNKAKEAGLVSRGKGKAVSKSKEPKEKKSRTEKTKSEKSDKKQKKPDNYPKAAQTAFFLFAGDQRGPLMAELKDVKLVAKQMGVLWGEVSADEKAKYEALAKQDKERFETDMAAFKAGGGEVISRSSNKSSKKSSSSKKSKKAKDPNAPKRPQTAFFLFAGDKRGPLMAELKDIRLVAKQMGVLWGEVSVEEKAKYEKLAEADKERYAKECAEKGISVKATTTAKAPKGKAQKRSGSSSSSSSGSSSDSSSDSSNSSSSSSSSDSD